MTYLHNIEKSAFRRGEYVGYAHGVWRITKPSLFGSWCARNVTDPCTPSLYARRLKDLSDKLTAFERIQK